MSNNTSNITPDVFNEFFTVKVMRYELYPADSPTCYCTGFEITNKNNGKSMYIDCQVSLQESSNNDENVIVQMGWSKVSDQVLSWATQIKNQPTVINQVFSPQF